MPASGERPSPAAGEIRTLIAAYVPGANTLDLGLAQSLWLTGDEASFIRPGGHEHGWQGIGDHLCPGVMGARYSQRRLVPGEAAVHVSSGRLRLGRIRPGVHCHAPRRRVRVESAGRQAQVFWPIDGDWRLGHVHYAPHLAQL